MSVTPEAARQREIARKQRAEMRRDINLASNEPNMDIVRLYDEMQMVIKNIVCIFYWKQAYICFILFLTASNRLCKAEGTGSSSWQNAFPITSELRLHRRQILTVRRAQRASA